MIRECIYNRMVQRGISLTVICNDLQLTPQNVSAFLRGKRGLPYGSFIKVMDYLGLTFAIGDKKSDLPNERTNILFKEAIKAEYGKVYIFVKTCGLSCSTVSSFLSGKRHPSFRILEKMAENLKIGIVKK